MKAAICVFSGMILLAAASTAGTAKATSTAFDKCMDKTGGVTVSMRDCADDEEVRQDRELNTLYKQAMTRLDAPGREQLQKQERIWLKRIKTCEQLQEEDGGTSVLLDYDSCRLDHYDKRINQLKALINGGR